VAGSVKSHDEHFVVIEQDKTVSQLTGRGVSSACLVGTDGEVDGCATFGTGMSLVELVRKNLFLRITFVTLANE